MVRIKLQNLPVDALRLDQLPSLMVLDGAGAHALQIDRQTLILPPGN
jgi:hypothetical protein